jgi:cytochrome c-type biogenesis protein CcmE
MDRKRLKFLGLISAVLLSMAFLVGVAMNRPGSMVYYLTVSEFQAQPEPGRGDFRVNGKVAQGSIERLPTGMDVRFTMVDDHGATLPVTYHGIIPDTFVDRAAVVVEGRLQNDGTFLAHQLLAKCPSKYEAADEHPVEPGRDAAARG